MALSRHHHLEMAQRRHPTGSTGVGSSLAILISRKARILVYHRGLEGRRLRSDEFVISADEKTSIRPAPEAPIAQDQPAHESSTSTRDSAWAYLAALDVHRFRLFGRCERKTGIAGFDRLVAQTMKRRPYRQARRVFWIVDNSTAHRGPAAVRRLRARFPNLVLVHGPIHASWLNQIEIYFSVLQRKALTPNDFPSLQALAQRTLNFQRHYQTIARPFEWRFTRKDLAALLRKLDYSLLAA
jgi:hypothetical protein